jgi:hypothetical protein
MIPPLPRGLRRGLVILSLVAGAGAPPAPHPAFAAGTVAALRGIPSSLSGRYAGAIPLGAVSPGRYLIPTRTGFEIREASQGTGDSLVATFRTSGRIEEAALSGNTAWLAAGSRGLLAVDIGTPAAPVLSGSYSGLGSIRHVAAAPASGTVAAASASTLYLLRESGGSGLPALTAHPWLDGREVKRLLTQNDSLLVTAQRPGRIFLTMFRVRAGAPTESLWDFQANNHQVQDAAWRDGTVFLADGNNGILPFDVQTRQLRPRTPLSGFQFVQSVDADDSVVVAVGGGNVFARFHRGGAFGDSLSGESDEILPESPVSVRLAGSHAIIAGDSELDPSDPDEVARSVIQDHDLATGGTGAPIGATGRVRRVILDGGLAYAADYTGGLRIYRGNPADSSLVGVLPSVGIGRTYDLALDAPRKLLYLASGTAGLEVVDVANAAAPSRVATAPVTGLARCVAAVGDTLLAVGWNSGGITAGVTFFDVTNASAPLARGTVSVGPLFTTIRDPRALAFRDTVLFVADAVSGVISVGFGDPDAPSIPGSPSGAFGTRDVSLLGTTLLVGTSARGVQVVDATSPGALVLQAEVPLPPVYGVTQQGGAAVALLGEEGAAILDVSSLGLPVLRGVIPVPGFARHAAWVGDTLCVATSYGLERYTLPVSLPQESPLALTYDDAGVRPRITAGWPAVALSGLVGFNLLREVLAAGGGLSSAPVRVNGALLPSDAVSFTDASLPSPGTYRYRLEAVRKDGSSVELAVGTISVASTARLGRPYPNPFRPSSQIQLTIPFRSQPSPFPSFRARIYDVAGRLVRSLVGSVPAGGGFAAAAWDGRDERGVPASSGLYWIHVRAPGIDEARSVVLLH